MGLTRVYIRHATYRAAPVRYDLAEPEKATLPEHQKAVTQLVDLLPCTVVNRALVLVSVDSKVYQASVAAAFGFGTPRTLVSTKPDAVQGILRGVLEPGHLQVPQQHPVDGVSPGA